MNQSIRPGENTTIASPRGSVTISHATAPNLDVNLTAFLIADNGKVVDDDGMVFYNAPRHASGAAVFESPRASGGSLSHSIQFDLGRLPTGIVKIAIALTEDGASPGFASMRNLHAQVQAGDDLLQLSPGGFSAEKGIIVLELYVRNGQCKARAVWQGFASGLQGLCGNYGVAVEEPSPPPAPAPEPPRLAKSLVTLDKPGESHKISLEKGAQAPKTIRVSATWIDNGDGRDNDDLDLRVGILLPDGRMKIIQAPDKPGAFDAEPFVFHTGDVTVASATAPGMESVEVNPEISQRLGGKVALVFSVYSAVSNGAVAIASLKPKMRMEYGDQVVECAFEFKKGFGSGCVYTYVIGIVEIDRQQIELRPSGVTSKFMSEATPWLRWSQGGVELSMDGPPVFKGKPLSRSGNKQYS